MNVCKFIFGHLYKWAAVVASILFLTAAPAAGEHCDICDELCCIGYVTDFGGGNVLVVDLNTGNILNTISTGAGAAGITYVPLLHKMFVANQNAGTVTVIDTKTRVARDIYYDPDSSPVGATLAPDGLHVWVTLATKNVSGQNGPVASGAVAIFNAHTEQLKDLISIGEPYAFPVDVQFLGIFAYVVDYFGNDPALGGDLTVINAVEGKVIGRIPVGIGSEPTSIAPLPDGITLYVTGSATSRVLAVNSVTGASTPIPTGFAPYKVVVNSGIHAWSANLSGSVSKINTLTNTVVATIPVAGAPFNATLSPDENTLYTLNVDNATIAVIDAHQNTVKRTFSIGTPGTTKPVDLAIVQLLREEP